MKFCRPLLPLVMALMSCQKPQPAAPAREMILHDSTLVFDTLRVDIRVPAGAVRADLLLLNGWNFPRTDWCDKSGFCAKALEQGYRLILPEMGKSVYHAHTWPETRKDWLAYPTGTQLFDSVIAQLANRYGILSGEVPAFVAGISTGGRGVALALVRKPGLFSGGVSLSGDFDQTTLPGDNLMTGYYGDYDRWPERWKTEDNPTTSASAIRAPFLILHGEADSVVPVRQSIAFADTLKQHGKQVEIHTEPGAGHDYRFWGAQTQRILGFFAQHFPPTRNSHP